MTELERNNLLAKAQGGDKASIKLIIDDTQNFIFYLCKKRKFKRYNRLFSLDHIICESTYSLLKAINTFDPSKSKWSTWAGRCIFFHLGHLAKKETIYKQRFRNNKISTQIISKDTPVIDTIISEEDIRSIFNSMNDLSVFHQNIIIDYYLNQRGQRDLAKQFNCTPQNINYHLVQAKKILKNRLFSHLS